MDYRGMDRKAPEPMAGRGYFNRGTTISAGLSNALAEARAPYTSLDGAGREQVDILKDGYHEAMLAAQEAYGQYGITEGDSNPVWTMPYMQRGALVADVQAADCYDEDAFDGLCAQADTFGMESLTEYAQRLVDGGREQWFNTVGYMDGVGAFDEGSGELRDTGRYVVLKSPGGERSQALMELEPRMDVHRFLDLEAPKGQAQILELKEGAYSVAAEVQDCRMVRDGIRAAKEYQAEHGHILSYQCGDGDLSVERSDLKTQFAGPQAKHDSGQALDRLQLHGTDIMKDAMDPGMHEASPRIDTGASFQERSAVPAMTAMDALNARMAHDEKEREYAGPSGGGRSAEPYGGL